MYKRYYDNYHNTACKCNHGGEEIIPKPTDNAYINYEKNQINAHNSHKECMPAICDSVNKGNLFSDIKTDDLILIGVLLLLMNESDSNDNIMLIIIGLILFSDSVF